jgi:hypothetical protein
MTFTMTSPLVLGKLPMGRDGGASGPKDGIVIELLIVEGLGCAKGPEHQRGHGPLSLRMEPLRWNG